MWAPAVTGLFTLIGVGFGVMLEPVKARTAVRIRQREVRAERAARLVEAANTTRSKVLWLNRLIRHQMHGEEDVSQQLIDEVTEAYWQARNELRSAFMLLQLSGPEDLVHQASAVRVADNRLWSMRRNDDGAALHKPSGIAYAAAKDLDAEIASFARLAMKYTN